VESLWGSYKKLGILVGGYGENYGEVVVKKVGVVRGVGVARGEGGGFVSTNNGKEMGIFGESDIVLLVEYRHEEMGYKVFHFMLARAHERFGVYFG